jgi:putative membrane protein
MLAGLAVTTGLYGLGLARLWRRAGVGRNIPLRRVASFLGGILALLMALSSPLDDLAARMFAAHMVQHLLLILVVAPLLVIALIPIVLLWALPLPARRSIALRGRLPYRARAYLRSLTSPVAVFLVYTLALWTWHLPGLYQGALASDVIHALEHLTFLAAASLFWWTILQPQGRRRLPLALTALYLFAASLQGSALGVLITFSPVPWYQTYAAGPRVWGFSPLQDQQLAGLLMWMPVGSIFALLSAVLLLLCLLRARASGASRGSASRARTTKTSGQPVNGRSVP